MSDENAEVARRLLGAIAPRDLALLMDLTDPEVEWRSFFAELGESGEYHGHEGLRRYIGDLSETWEGLAPEVDGLLEVGDVVIGVGRIHYRGKESGAESEAAAGWMFRFTGGKVIEFRAFRNPEQALRAVGLAE